LDKKIKVGSLAIMAILVTHYFRPITLRPIFSDSLPFSTFSKATYSLLSILFPNFAGFRQEWKKFIKFFPFTNYLIRQFTNCRKRNRKDRFPFPRE